MSKSREYCSVPHCSSSRKKNPNLMFHQFPKKDEKMLTVDDFGNKLIIERRLIWTINLQMWRRVKRHMKVCSLHFLDSDYQRSGWSSKRTLCPSAIPSQSLPYNNNVTGKRKKVPEELLDLRPYRQEKSMEQDEGCSYLGTGETVIVNHAGDSITLSNNPISWEEEEHLTVFDTERDVEYLKKEADFLKIQLEVKNDELREVREELSLVKSEYKKSRNLLKSFCIHNNKRGKLFV